MSEYDVRGVRTLPGEIAFHLWNIVCDAIYRFGESLPATQEFDEYFDSTNTLIQDAVTCGMSEFAVVVRTCQIRMLIDLQRRPEAAAALAQHPF